MTSLPFDKREEILKSFAIDFDDQSEVLKSYLTKYPELALDLVDLSSALSHLAPDLEELSELDRHSVQDGLQRYRKGSVLIADLSSAPVSVFKDAGIILNLPMQVMVALRERRIELASIPPRFMSLLASALKTTQASLIQFLQLPPQAMATRANKSMTKPAAAVKVTLERILRDAEIPSQRLLELLSKDD